jgi:immune inhibitor A
MIRRITEHRLRATALVPAVALVAAGLAAAGSTASVSAAPASVPAANTHGDYYLNTVAPRAEIAVGSDVQVKKGKSTAGRAAKQADIMAKA